MDLLIFLQLVYYVKIWFTLFISSVHFILLFIYNYIYILSNILLALKQIPKWQLQTLNHCSLLLSGPDLLYLIKIVSNLYNLFHKYFLVALGIYKKICIAQALVLYHVVYAKRRLRLQLKSLQNFAVESGLKIAFEILLYYNNLYFEFELNIKLSKHHKYLIRFK